MVYSEVITAKGVLGLTSLLSCYKFTVKHGFLGLIALLSLVRQFKKVTHRSIVDKNVHVIKM